MNEIINELKQEIQRYKNKLSAQLEENVRLRGFKQIVMSDPGKHTWKERAEEAELGLANALAENEKLTSKKSDAELETSLVKAVGMNSPEMRDAKERIKELERINEEHRQMNGDLRREITIKEQEVLETHADNKKLAAQVEDQLKRAREAGL